MFCVYVKVGFAPVAQWIECLASDQKAAGSNPAGRTMKEIEIKVRVDDLDALEKKFEERGIKFGPAVTQFDRCFAEDIDSLGESQPGVKFFRLRCQNDEVILTFKRTLHDTVSTEHELVISDEAQAVAILGELGFKEGVQVTKKRRKAKHNDIEICLDEVEGLGTFLELEKLSVEADSHRVQDELFAWANQFGVSREDQVLIGYDIMAFRKNRAEKAG